VTRGRPTGLVDLHAHFLPEEYRLVALANGQEHPDGMPALPMWDPNTAVQLMDQVGVATAALSLSSPGVNFLPSGPERSALARTVNDAGAEVVRRHPGRFALLATLPLPSIESAMSELDRAVDDLGAIGVALYTHVDGVYLGDARLEPLLAALDARGLVVTIHPVSPCGWESTAFGRPPPMVEFLFDTTRAVTHLLLSGAFYRHPHIRWVVPHAGAALPILADRVAAFAPWVSPEAADGDVVATLGRLHYDLAGTPVPRGLPALLSLVPPTQVVYGSDYPFTPPDQVLGLSRSLDAFAPFHDTLGWPLLADTGRRLLQPAPPGSDPTHPSDRWPVQGRSAHPSLDLDRAEPAVAPPGSSETSS